MKKFLAAFLFLSGLLAGSAFLVGGPRSAVDWREVRGVVLESDDWGLAGFIPGPGAWNGLDRDDLGPGRFPEVYWGSTLEDSADVAELASILAAVEDADGLPAVFQPNYVTGSLHWREEGAGPGAWETFELPRFPPGYERPGLWAAVDDALARGLWYPEFHAAFHYDRVKRQAAAFDGDTARKATLRGIILFPGSERARELAPGRPAAEVQREFHRALAVFAREFGRPPDSIMAPDYTWNAAMERMWTSRGVRIIQGKREQIDPSWGGGRVGRLRKYAGRRWDKMRRRDRIYLERNCRLEPVQAPDPGRVVADGVAATRRAWRAGQPAIVETHRVNFVHTDPAVETSGREALRNYLGGVAGLEEGAPRFLVDREVAALNTHGTSWAIRGDLLVVRNATRSRRIVPIPAAAVVRFLAGRVGDLPAGGNWLVAVEPGGVQVMDAAEDLTWGVADR